MEEFLGKPISVYTRAQAIEDGVLTDVTEMAKKIGFKLHSVIAAGLMGEVEREAKRTDKGIDFVIYFLLRTAYFAVMNSHRDQNLVEVLLPWTPHKKFWSHVGPGDEGEAVLTFMSPEDY